MALCRHRGARKGRRVLVVTTTTDLFVAMVLDQFQIGRSIEFLGLAADFLLVDSRPPSAS